MIALIDINNIVLNIIIATLAEAPEGNWVDCNAWVGIGMNINAPMPPYWGEPTASENKATASGLLSATDWTTIADVGNPQMANPYLANQSEFLAYRNTIRQIAVYPVAGNLTWATVPVEVWTKV